MSDLSGRVAVVTGAGRGIGRDVARRLAADGATVALCSRTEEDLEAVVAEIEGGGEEQARCRPTSRRRAAWRPSSRP